MAVRGWQPAIQTACFSAQQSLSYAGAASASAGYITLTANQVRCALYGKVGFAMTLSQSSGTDSAATVSFVLAQGPLQTTNSSFFVGGTTVTAAIAANAVAVITSQIHSTQNCPGWFAISLLSMTQGGNATGTLLFRDFIVAHAY